MPAKRRGRKRRKGKAKRKTINKKIIEHSGTHFHPHHKGGAISAKKKRHVGRRKKKQVRLVRIPI
jgi:hypothetical protein